MEQRALSLSSPLSANGGGGKQAKRPKTSHSSAGSSNDFLLDRTIVTILPNPDRTPTTTDCIKKNVDAGAESNINDADKDDNNKTLTTAVEVERLHRFHGISLIRSSCQLLRLTTSCCFGTACILFHRYFHAVSLHDADVWSIAMGSILVAAKTQEIPLTIKQVILVFAHLYRKRRMIYIPKCDSTNSDENESTVNDGSSNEKNICSDDATVEKLLAHHSALRRSIHIAPEARWSWNKKHAYLRDGVPAMSPLGPVWKEWHAVITQAEHKILRQLGFTIHWIPHNHPHKYLSRFGGSVLLLPDVTSDNPSKQSTSPSCQISTTVLKQQVHQRAWNYCNDSFLLDLCVRYPPSYVACAALYLACLDVWLEHEHSSACSTKSNDENGNQAQPQRQQQQQQSTANATNDSHLLVSWLEAFPDWPERLCGSGCTADIAIIANSLLSLRMTTTATTAINNFNDRNSDTTHLSPLQLDFLLAFHGFVPPLYGGSFNGPHSFLWDMANDLAHRRQDSFT
ncbi:hypothetical protein ACA910_022429 [Epithemia clementina (nom. ined.)]